MILFSIFICFLIFLIILYYSNKERRLWNGGRCPRCGYAWIFKGQSCSALYKWEYFCPHCYKRI